MPTKTLNSFTMLSIVLGAALIDAGAALVYRPAGFIVGGAFLLTAGVLSVKGKK